MSMMQAVSAACSTATLAEEIPEGGTLIRPFEVKTLEETLVAEGLPVQWTWVMRFTLFPPQDNVIVASGCRGLSVPFGPSAARAVNSFRLVDASAQETPVRYYMPLVVSRSR